ncbi:MAG: ral secretory pathway protein [Betaproteobacteria bacterium]|nr:ral secretory pathway protein [Betaproteobacteria bacterium]
MTRKSLLACVVLVYAAALTAMAPASLLGAGLGQLSDNRLRLASVQGTVWSGAAQLVALSSDGRVVAVKDIAWRVQPLWLLRGSLAVDVAFDGLAKHIPVRIGFDRVEFADVDINLPAAVLALGVPQLAPFELGGMLFLHVTNLVVTRNAVRGDATLQWRAASSALTPVSPLGDYELQIGNDGNAMRASLQTLRGPLALAGSGGWAPDAGPRFVASARVSAQYQEQLKPLLRLIAVERSDGDFELSLR